MPHFIMGNSLLLNLMRLPTGTALLNWNSELPSSSTGDPLGMTLRVGARLGAELLHCITSITPRARYYSFFLWAFQRAHDRIRGSATFGEAMRLVLIDERAMMLGAVLHHDGRPCDGGGLQGSNSAVTVATESKGQVDLAAWHHLRDNASGFAAYKGSLINLGLFEETASSSAAADDDEEESTALITGKPSAKGQRLARAFGLAVAGTRFIGFRKGQATVGRIILKEFGAAAGLCELLDAEQADLRPLRDLFFATDSDDQFNSHFRRRMSLLLLLWAVNEAHEAGVDLNMQAFDDMTYYRMFSDNDGETVDVEVPPLLVDIGERWRMFHFHNYLTTALEALLAGLLRAIRYHPAGRTVREILDAFDTTEARSALGELLGRDLSSSFMDLTPAASLALLGINHDRAIDGTVSRTEAFDENPLAERFLRDALTDMGLVSGLAGPAVAALLLYTLLLRYELSVGDVHKGWNTKKVFDPFADVAMPTVARALDTDLGQDWWSMSNRDVLSRVLNRFVIRQHETMSYEKGFGGSPPLFRVDGNVIVGSDQVRDEVLPGNPRFPSAIQVLTDLALISADSEGVRSLTDAGQSLLDTFLEQAAQ